MINLLPVDEKKEIKAARANIVLINYIFFLSVAIMFLAITCVASYFLLTNMKKSAENTIKNDQSSLGSFSTNNGQVNDIGAVILTAQTILGRHIPYSDILISIGSSLPYGAIVDKISLNVGLLNSPLTVEFHIKSSGIASELIANLKKSPMFSNVSAQPAIVSPGNSPDYPVMVTCELTIIRTASL